jgi:hypothetical protein
MRATAWPCCARAAGEHAAAIAHWLALTQEAGTPRPQQAYLFSNWAMLMP